MSILTLPQGRIPIGFAMVNGQKVSVDVDPEWMRYFTILTSRAGGVTGLSIAELDALKQDIDEKGIANGYAGLGATALVPTAQLATGTADGTKVLFGDQTWGDLPVSGAATEGTALLDFGASPGTSEASIVITGQTDIALTSNVRAFITGDSTSTDHTAADHKYAAALIGLTTGAIVAGVGFTIYGRCLDKLEGDFTINWEWV